MLSLAERSTLLQTLLTTTADDLARQDRLIRRRRKLSGAILLQTLILGWLAHPAARLTQLTQVAARRGVVLTPQALDQRFTPALGDCLRHRLGAAVAVLVGSAEPVAIPLLARFTAVRVVDSTTLALPAALADTWPGCGGRPGQGLAALKLSVALDLRGGALDGPLLASGRTHDRVVAQDHAPLPAGGLDLRDLGYNRLAHWATLNAQQAYWLTPLPLQVALFDPLGGRIEELGRWLNEHAGTDTQVAVALTLGARHRLPGRLLAARVPPLVAAERRRKLRRQAQKKGQALSAARLALADWTVLVTNLPAAHLSLAEALVLYRARWQFELLFKRWKQHGHLDHWRTTKPERILAEVYAKLIGLVLQHWLYLSSGRAQPAKSLVKAAVAIRDQALVLISLFDDVATLECVLDQLARCLRTATANRRKTRPNTYQRLLDSTLAP